MEELPEKVRVDLAEITFGEMIDATEAADVADVTRASPADQARLNAAFCWVVLRRDYPSVTYADALALPVSRVEVIQATDPLVPTDAATDGSPPLASGAPGTSDR